MDNVKQIRFFQRREDDINDEDFLTKFSILELIESASNIFIEKSLLNTNIKLILDINVLYATNNKLPKSLYDFMINDSTGLGIYYNLKLTDITFGDKKVEMTFTKDLDAMPRAVCFCNEGYESELSIGISYEDIPGRDDSYIDPDWVTTINDKGDDESYPSELFTRLNY